MADNKTKKGAPHPGRAHITTIGITAAVFLLFLAGSLVFVNWQNNDNAGRVTQYLDDATNQRATALEQQVEGDFQVLRGVAIALSEMDLTDSEKINSILDAINKSNAFARMGLADAAGKVDLVDIDGSLYPGVDLSGMHAFHQALEGQDAVSETFYEKATGEYVNYYVVPVYQDGVIVAALCAANRSDILKDIINVPVFQGEGYFGVIDSRGVIMHPVSDPDPAVEIGVSVLDLVRADRDELSRFRADLQNGQAGDFVFEVRGETHLAAITPLSFNHWSVISVTPRDPISDYYNRAGIGTLLIVLAASLVFLFLIIRQIRIMNQNRAQLEHLAYTDPVTGARNYAKFQLDAEAFLANNPRGEFAVWSFDLKDFRRINDIYGNDAGNRVLDAVARVLAEDTAEDPLFCRNSADQFAGLRPSRGRADMTAWFEDLLCRLRAQPVIAENRIQVDGAMGVYFPADFDDTPTIDNMVNRSAVAKKEAKAEAGSAIDFFTPQMQERVRWDAELTAGARAALDSGAITFHMQPKVSIQGGNRLTGAEVLARWYSDEHGIIPPGAFVPLFESSGFVVELDRHIFRQACQWLSAWLDAGNEPLTIAVNVSRQGLLRDDLIPYYTGEKQRHGIPDGLMELEFTEGVFLDDYPFFAGIVQQLQRGGFHCSIDDFGSGYSSLNVLKNLPIDVLKLDAVFFRESEDPDRAKAVIRAFIQMARELHVRTVAEGVESADQVTFLRYIGCDVIQGYVFSKPLPQAEFEKLVHASGRVLKPKGQEKIML